VTGFKFVSADLSSNTRLGAKRVDTRDTDFYGNWFPREEHIDFRGTERREENYSLSWAYWKMPAKLDDFAEKVPLTPGRICHFYGASFCPN